MKIALIRSATTQQPERPTDSDIAHAVEEAIDRFGLMRFAESLTYASEQADQLPIAA